MSRNHDQKPDKRFMTCISCREDNCDRCIDRIRAIYSSEMVCTCERQMHVMRRDGEAILNQIKDPETGTVYAPGLSIDTDGTVHYRRDSDSPFH